MRKSHWSPSSLVWPSLRRLRRKVTASRGIISVQEPLLYRDAVLGKQRSPANAIIGPLDGRRPDEASGVVPLEGCTLLRLQGENALEVERDGHDFHFGSKDPLRADGFSALLHLIDIPP